MCWRFKQDKSWVRILVLSVFQLGHWSSPALRLEHMLLAVLVLRPLDSDCEYATNFPGSQLLSGRR